MTAIYAMSLGTSATLHANRTKTASIRQNGVDRSERQVTIVVPLGCKVATMTQQATMQQTSSADGQCCSGVKLSARRGTDKVQAGRHQAAVPYLNLLSMLFLMVLSCCSGAHANQR